MATSQMSELMQHLRRAVLLRDGAGLTDGQLLKDYLSRRDEAALEALVRRHGPMVWGVCRRVLHNYHDAEDAFQATFLVLVRKAGSVVPREMVANWLYGVAHQTALKARATNAKRRARERQVTEMPEPVVTEQDLWNDLQPLLDQELSRLPDKYRVAIVLCDLEGKTRKEAARQLGVPEGTLAARMARGRGMLAKRLARHGLAVSGASLAAVLAQNAASASAPTTVVSSTIKAASLFAAGRAAATGVISAKVAALTEGVVKAMLLRKLKIGAAMLLVFAGIGLAGLALNSAPLQAELPVVQKEEPREPKPFAAAAKVISLAWSPDRSTLVTVGYQRPKEKEELVGNSTVQFWDARTGKEKRSLGEVANTQLSDLVYSPDGKAIAMSSFKRDGDRCICEVKLYDAAKGELLREFASHDVAYGKLTFSPDGKMLASAGEKFEPFTGPFERIVAEVKLWDVATGQMKRLLEDKRELDFFHRFNVLAFSPDGKTLAAAGIRFEYTKDMIPEMPDLKNPIGMNPLNHNEVVLWDVDTGKVKRVLKGNASWFISATFSPDGRSVLVSDQQGVVRIWDPATGKLERKLRHDHAPWSALSPDGKWLATAGGEVRDGKRAGTVKLWDYRTGEVKHTLSELDGLTGRILFSPDNKRLAVGVRSTVRIWDIEKAAFEQ
jgi:RNA polymerase sigma factor (sigma-70 family)